jgi:hypothetical protein
MTYARARQCFIALLLSGLILVSWQWGKSEAEVSRLQGVNQINVATIAKLKSDPQTRLNEAFRHYGENKVRKFLKKKGQADI